jgi:TRAP-type uncharacterized transport system fused permease subunit
MGSPLMIAYKVFTAFIGISCMAVTFNGYLFRDLNWRMRTLFLIGGLALLYPLWVVTVPGYALIGIIVFMEIAKHRGMKPTTVGQM